MTQTVASPDLLAQASLEIRAALPKSTAQAEAAARILPGGSSRARFWWPTPIFMEHASGAYVTDLDGVQYVDCNLGFGSMVLGHAHPDISAALTEQIPKGVFFGAANVGEEAWARRITDNIPGAEKVVFLNSGTEATLAALRIARTATGREKVGKFEGGWHGPQEYLLHSYTTVGGDVRHPDVIPENPGIPRGVTDTVVALPYNHPAAFDLIRAEADNLACVIVEAVQGGGGAMPADPDFLRGLREVCDEIGAVFIVDEVITGFRVGPGSASARYGITPDLVTLGKAIGGGLPAGAVCGRSDLIDVTLPKLPMDPSPRRPVNIAGTFSGNPMTSAAGVVQIDTLMNDPDAYPRLQRLGDRMRTGLTSIMRELEVSAFITGIDSMWGVHFSPASPSTVRDKGQDNAVAARLLAAYLLLEGVLMSSPVHLSFVSTAHTEEDVDTVLEAHRAALTRMRREGCV
jgi:glutamate-1-semialdehyde 2,1-aminomutase